MPNTSLRRPQKGYVRRGGKQAYHGGGRTRTFAATTRTEATAADERAERTLLAQQIDEAMGFARFESGRRKEGWLVNVQPTTVGLDGSSGNSGSGSGTGTGTGNGTGSGGRAALDCYFIEEDGQTFKATVEYEPYILIAVRRGRESEVEEWLKRVPGGGGGVVRAVRRVEKDDLSMPNHLLGYRRGFLELRFANVQDLLAVRRDIMPVAERNRKAMGTVDVYAEVAA